MAYLVFEKLKKEKQSGNHVIQVNETSKNLEPTKGHYLENICPVRI